VVDSCRIGVLYIHVRKNDQISLNTLSCIPLPCVIAVCVSSRHLVQNPSSDGQHNVLT
jgi:hypothetical protein